MSSFNVYMGLDRTIEELGIDTHEIAVNTTYDFDVQYKDMLAGPDGEVATVFVTAFNVADPDFSPPGTSIVSLTILGSAKPWLELSPSEYVDAKNGLADKAITMAEKVIPDLRNCIEEIEVSTPLTNIRYTGNIGGTIYGTEQTPLNISTMRHPNRGPLKGLYFAGAWIREGGGFEPCIESGLFASEAILEDMEKGGVDADTMEEMEEFLSAQGEDCEPMQEVPLSNYSQTRSLTSRKLSLKVHSILEKTATAKTFRMVSANGELPFFRAGQYINLFVNIGGVLTSRPYTICSPPGKSYYDLTVRRMTGGFVSDYLLDQVKTGDLFESTKPAGNFYYEPLRDSTELVFLAGGCGITPFMSIIRDVVEQDRPYNIHLIYGSRVPEDIIFEKELEALADAHQNIKVDFVMSEPPAGWTGKSGFLDENVISSLVESMEDKTFFICGPGPMYGLCEGALKSLGVPARRIRKEVYGPPADITGEPGWPGVSAEKVVEVIEERSGKKIKAKAGEPLMIALEREGLVIPAVCRSGECSACRTKLISGKVFAPARVHLRWADEKSNYIHPCRSYPVKDLRIRI
jgi:ferredoxin-NADP reductase